MQSPNAIPAIIVDFRENQSRVSMFLQKLGVRVETADLAVDYAIGAECLVERKTVADFVASIIDGRLFKQVAHMASHCARPLMLLEGGGLYRSGRISANIIRGAMLWVCVRKRVSLIRTLDEYDTACLLTLLAKQQLRKTDLALVRRKREPLSAWEREVNILSHVPNIGRQNAKDLLKAFGSLANITEASDVELESLRGIGKKRLANIRRFFPIYSRTSSLHVSQPSSHHSGQDCATQKTNDANDENLGKNV